MVELHERMDLAQDAAHGGLRVDGRARTRPEGDALDGILAAVQEVPCAVDGATAALTKPLDDLELGRETGADVKASKAKGRGGSR